MIEVRWLPEHGLWQAKLDGIKLSPLCFEASQALWWAHDATGGKVPALIFPRSHGA